MLNKAKSLSHSVGPGCFNWMAGMFFTDLQSMDGETKPQNIQGQKYFYSNTVKRTLIPDMISLCRQKYIDTQLLTPTDNRKWKCTYRIQTGYKTGDLRG